MRRGILDAGASGAGRGLANGALLRQDTDLPWRRLLAAADPLGLHVAAVGVLGFGAEGSTGSSCQQCSGAAGDWKGVFVRGWKPLQSLVHTVVVPLTNAWQGLVNPTAASVV